MDLERLSSDGTPAGTVLAPPEKRAVGGEELWWPPSSTAGVTVTESTALHLTPFLTGVSVIATDVAMLPLDVYQRMPDDSRREAREHPVSELMARSPDRGVRTPMGFKQALMGHAVEYGNGYAEIQRTGRGAPYALYLLDPDLTKPKEDGGRPGYFDGRAWYPAADVLHVSGFSYDGRLGYRLVQLVREAIAVGLAQQTYSADYFANGSEPGGVIETPQKLGKPGRENLADGWAMRHGGPGKRFKIAVLEQGCQWKPTGVEPEKSQLVESRKFQAIDAVRPLRVPPSKFGDWSEAHLANVEASNLDYLISTLMAWLTAIEQECNLKLLTRAEWKAGYYLEHNVNALLRGDITSRFNAYGSALRDGWMNRDEVRRRENLNPIGAAGGGQLYTVQAQVVPLDQAGSAFAQTQPAPAPAPGTNGKSNGVAEVLP